MRHCIHMQQHLYGSHSALRRWHELQCKRCRTSVSMAVNVAKNPRYPGNYPELWGVPYSKLRQAIYHHPTLLADCGIRREDFKPEGKRSSIHLDHIIPQSLGGPNHTLNIVLMENHRNYYFGVDLTAEKAQEVGPQTMLAATEFYVHFPIHKAALGPGVHQALLQQLQPFGSLRVRAVPLLAGSMNSSW